MSLKTLPLSAAVLLSVVTSPLFAGTYTVSNLNDSGADSLRAAISSANGDPGSTIDFSVAGVITLASALPDVRQPTTIDGTTAPGYAGVPVVSVDFNGATGLLADRGADGSDFAGLSLVGAGNSGITLKASGVAIRSNYIGLKADGTVQGNLGDGVSITSSSHGNVIGHFDPITGVDYYNTSNPTDFTIQPVSAWQGIRNSGTTPGEFLICGSTDDNGLLYIGALAGGGTSYPVVYPGPNTISTSVYGPDNIDGGAIRLVGSFRAAGSTGYNSGFVWEGTPDLLPSGGVFRPIDYPGATYQYTHSTMGKLAVGNADGPISIDGKKLPLGAGKAYIYDLQYEYFLTNIIFPGSKSNTAYGIWQNGPTSYTICGGYSPIVTSNLQNPELPLTQGKAFLVDYDSHTGKFTNWTSFNYPNGPEGVDFISHFEGISSAQPGIYTLSADSVETGGNVAQGSWVEVLRNADGTFSKGTWLDLNAPAAPGSVSSSNSVYGFAVVGLVVGPDTFPFQAQVNVEFQLSNVISGNQGQGISADGSTKNLIAMNYIGTDPTGNAAGFGNGGNGILLANKSRSNLIGGVAFGANNPTGNKNPVNAVFQRPIQGNLISGNLGHGVVMNNNSTGNVLSGNYIGTDAVGTAALGNGGDGVVIDNASDNALLGCTLYQNPFVYYNVVSGNAGHGVRVKDAKNVTIQANFLGMGSDNATSVPNAGNGLLVEGSSKATQVGGVIPLGNVIAGNALNGIEVKDRVSKFVSFNTFCGIAAFQPFASGNGRNGILITSTGGKNTIRTCIISGNVGNGIEIGGEASGVEVTETSCGTNTDINGPIPNEGHGIVLSGHAHDNQIGGFQASVEPEVFVSGNLGSGIVVKDSAHSNTILHASVGGGALRTAIPNQSGGIRLDPNSRNTSIGGKGPRDQVLIVNNLGPGLSLDSTKKNTITGNMIKDNTQTGIIAIGNCQSTKIKYNTVEDNGAGGTDNVNLSSSSGIQFRP